MQTPPAGRVRDAAQPLLDDPDVVAFLYDEKVIDAASVMGALSWWLIATDGCQHNTGDHSHGKTTLRAGNGMVRLCFQCNNMLREQEASAGLEAAGNSNAAEWVLYFMCNAFQMPEGHHVTLPEVAMWAAMNNVASLMPDALSRRVLRLPALPVPRGTLKESDINHMPPATEMLTEKVAQVVKLAADPETPESFLLRPKRRWVNDNTPSG